MKTEPSQRVEVLAQHKTYAPLKIKSNSQWDWSEWESDLAEAAKNATASERVLVLSNPKLPHRSYKEGWPVIWKVSQSAQKALPSIRVQQLARPKSRSQYNEDDDPNAWKVSQGAKSAQATPRIRGGSRVVQVISRNHSNVSKPAFIISQVLYCSSRNHLSFLFYCLLWNKTNKNISLIFRIGFLFQEGLTKKGLPWKS